MAPSKRVVKIAHLARFMVRALWTSWGTFYRCAALSDRHSTKMDSHQMTNTDTHSPHSNAYGPSGRVPVAGASKDDLASKGATAFREAKANVGDMISDAGDYAGKRGREAMDNMRGVGDTLAVAVERSVTARPYTTLAVAAAAGFLGGAIWRR